MKIEEANTTVKASLPKASLFSVNQLGALSWLLGAPEGERRFVVKGRASLNKFFETRGHHEDGKRLTKSFVKDPREADAEHRALSDMLFGRFEIEFFEMRLKGLVDVYDTPYPTSKATVFFADKVADIHIPGRWSGELSYVEASAAAREWWEAVGRARYEKLAGKINATAAAVKRRAVFGRVTTVSPKIPEEVVTLFPDRSMIPFPRSRALRPMISATIVKESPKRFQIVDDQPINGQWGTSMITGIHEKWIDREFLLVDNVSDGELAKITAFDKEHADEVTAACVQAAVEIAPIIRRLAERMKQKEAEHVDGYADVIKSILRAREDKKDDAE